jgi:uncharacterized repeat protein (TIGR03803 family)
MRLRAIGIALALAVVLVPAVAVQAQNYSVLYNFKGPSNDGANPYAGLIQVKGTLYGTTYYGGSSTNCTYGCGTMFKLSTSPLQETVFHSFTGYTTGDGANPRGGLVWPGAGSTLYGTTDTGGTSNYGTVFEWTGSKETVLYNFCSKQNCTDGALPYAGLLYFGPAGFNYGLWGTTNKGGTSNGGTVFWLEPNSSGSGWTERVIHSFTGAGTDGSYPWAGLWWDGSRYFYGTTANGGAYGYGTIFKLDTSNTYWGTVTMLHSFQGSAGSDGAYPSSSTLVSDGKGNLYGTTHYGGSTKCSDGCGTVFKYDTIHGTYTPLYNFLGMWDGDGQDPIGGLVWDAGMLYGTTFGGGDMGGGYCSGDGCGTVFQVDTKNNNKYTLLYGFSGYKGDGAGPMAGLVQDSAHNLYGTTWSGGSTAGCNDWYGVGCGVVFKLTPP